MKKFLGMLVAVCVVAMMTGCATTIPFGSENASSLSGDVPKVGQVVNIISVIGRETSGPAEQLVVWETVNTADQPKVLVATRTRLVSDEARGQFLIQKDVETVIKFTRLDQ